jgi:hypothetical protein
MGAVKKGIIRMMSRLRIKYLAGYNSRVIGMGNLRVVYQLDKASTLSTTGYLIYRCNICGQACETSMTELGREDLSCLRCGSSVRMRSIIHILSMELYGESLVLLDFPVKPGIRGMGLSDWDGYAVVLGAKLGYQNTYYHQEPKLDIAAIESTQEGTVDFLISADVFEHVAPPVDICFRNAYRLLKPNGFMIFSVPYVKEGDSLEHFVDLHDYRIIQRDKKYILSNITTDGDEQVFENLQFHGGDGTTLVMRVFSESSLRAEFAKAGFRSVEICKSPMFEYGIYWDSDESLPMVARK